MCAVTSASPGVALSSMACQRPSAGVCANSHVRPHAVVLYYMWGRGAEFTCWRWPAVIVRSRSNFVPLWKRVSWYSTFPAKIHWATADARGHHVAAKILWIQFSHKANTSHTSAKAQQSPFILVHTVDASHRRTTGLFCQDPCFFCRQMNENILSHNVKERGGKKNPWICTKT